MIQEIQLKGTTAVPSDYACPDGDLSVSLNLINENGELHPIPEEETVRQMSEGDTIMFQHRNANYSNLIVYNSNDKNLYWLSEDYTRTLLASYSAKQIYQVSGIGNILLVLTDAGIDYYMWDNTYKYLGNHLPELPISFSLKGDMIKTDTFELTFTEPKPNSREGWELSDENIERATSTVLAQVNKFIAEKSVDAGKFLFPFFVRYAYRLYDGSHTMQSAPILMVASSKCAPLAVFEEYADPMTTIDVSIIGAVHELQYQLDKTDLDELKKWKDIVYGIDIFISAPIYTYDQNGKCEKLSVKENGRYDTGEQTYALCLHDNSIADKSTYPRRYQLNTYEHMYAFTFDTNLETMPAGRVILPFKDDDVVKDDIKNTASFYLVKKFNLDDLVSDTRTTIEISGDTLSSLQARETLEDDYDSHDLIMAKHAFPYNQRMNLANISKQLFDGFSAKSLFCYTDGYVTKYTNETPTIYDLKKSVYADVFIKKDGKEIVVRGGSFQLGVARQNDTSKGVPILFFYYPNMNAYKAVIHRTDGLFDAPLVVNLEPHNMLNGAFYFGGWNLPSEHNWANDGIDSSTEGDKYTNEEDTFIEAEPSTDKSISLSNRLYTSEVDNPFFYPVEYMNAIGNGAITGLSAATKALSEGQFGQFPLYTFTDEGIWAMEVSSEGTYSSKQVTSRDVCLNKESITQIDVAVLYSADRGIMMLSGSESICISDLLMGEGFNPDILPNFKVAVQGIPDIRPFREFFLQSRMLFVYGRQHVILYHPEVSYAYVYSLKSKSWGMMKSDIVSSVNSYPDTLAMTSDYRLVTMPTRQSDEPVDVCLISRPIKIQRDILKTISSVITRGNFDKGDISTILYASRDLRNWFPVKSSADHYLRAFSGTPYRYFRLVAYGKLQRDETIYGASVQVEARMTNKLR